MGARGGPGEFRAFRLVWGLQQKTRMDTRQALGRGVRGATLAVVVLTAGGALGQRVEPSATTPIFQRSAPPPAVKAIATGARHTCAVVGDDGRVMCWGQNTDGQLGDGTMTSRTKPAFVLALSGARELAVGSTFSCALLTSGNVMCWGRLPGRPVAPTFVSGLAGVRQLAAGAGHACALVSDYSVRCWGENAFGQVGDGAKQPALTPVAVPGVTRVMDLTLGWQHSCALVPGGTVKCWGAITDGQLGNALVPLGPSSGSATPVDVTGLAGATAIAGGAAHTCAIVAGGVRCWGANGDGQLGDGSHTPSTAPVVVPGLAGAQKIAAGRAEVCVLVNGRGVQCWGWFGPTITEGLIHRPMLAPTKVMEASTNAELIGARDIASGGGHACVVRTDSTALCWGNNVDGELGAPTGTCGAPRDAYACSRAAIPIVWP